MKFHPLFLASCVVCAACTGSTFDTEPDGSVDSGTHSDAKYTKDADVEPDVRDAGPAADVGEPSTLVGLGSASNYTVLTKAGVSIVTSSSITGDIGVSPAAATYLTGFSLILDSSNRFSTSTLVAGKVYAADYALPTPADTATAIDDVQLASSDAAGRTPTVSELGGGNIGGMILAAGVYAWSTSVNAITDVVLSGTVSDVWIFQVAQDLTLGTSARIVLNGGAVPEHVFWQVSGAVDLGTAAHVEGVVLAHTAITVQTGASVKGRLYAQTAITIAGNATVTPY